jgi:hypothetical protein
MGHWFNQGLCAAAGILLGMLPPTVHIRKQADRAALRWSVERMMQELREQQPGGYLVAQRLAHMMLVQAPRLHLAERSRGGFSPWRISRLGEAINVMHNAPAHYWTLQARWPNEDHGPFATAI